ncbi:MAG: type II secretion system protein [Bdellovibrionales bacterium]|jgi:general secretion pathway protein H|nr:type II secretion system protein [Bdellovibrionales bacterium]
MKAVRNSRGFTLIEIMVVLLIMGGVLAIGGTRLFNPSENRRGQIRQLAIQAKELRTYARLRNSTYRLAIAMDDKGGHRYWVESASGHVLQLSETQEEELAKLTEIQREDAIRGRAKFEKEKKPGDVKLTTGLKFEGVEIAGRSKEFTSGIAYIHFFPQGLSEEALIKIGDGNTHHWTIAIHPLTGVAEILSRQTTLKELKSQ